MHFQTHSSNPVSLTLGLQLQDSERLERPNLVTRVTEVLFTRSQSPSTTPQRLSNRRGDVGWEGGADIIWLWVKTNGIPFWARCTTHFRTYFTGIGMFTGGMIWILTHGHMAVAQKTGTQNGTLVSGNMDQNLRNPSCLILSHAHIFRWKFMPTTGLAASAFSARDAAADAIQEVAVPGGTNVKAIGGIGT